MTEAEKMTIVERKTLKVRLAQAEYKKWLEKKRQSTSNSAQDRRKYLMGEYAMKCFLEDLGISVML